VTQQDLPLPLPRGGARLGAGRPKIKGRRASEPHKTRSKVDPRKPLHVVLRAVRGLRLRKKGVYHAIREALARTKWVRIIHLSIQQSHVHLIVEAQHAANLAKGMKSFQISAAKKINAATGRDGGQVFADRYHAVSLGSPRQVRNTLAYVLNNWRHHGAEAGARECDPFSSGMGFDGWTATPVAFPESYVQLPVAEATTWLLRVGWKRHAALIDLAHVPGGAHAE